MASQALLRALLVLVGFAELLGCRESSSIELRRWTVMVDGTPTPHAVVLPTRLDDGRVPAVRARYRMRTIANVPEALRSVPLQLTIPDLAAVVWLHADGTEAIDLNQADKHGYRRRGPHAWSIPVTASSDGHVELELIVEHTWTQSAWWGTVPQLHRHGLSEPPGSNVYRFNLLASGAALVALLQSAIASLMIYIQDRRRRVYLPFGVQGAVAAVYPAFVAGWTQGVWEPWMRRRWRSRSSWRAPRRSTRRTPSSGYHDRGVASGGWLPPCA
ncbi:MAG: hypothetical protein M3680_07355 [Myxococcota bacterium]|nr:hypothetical protein [Myxococcota bacterium]